MSGMAKVILKEVDLSTRVASFAGVYGAIVIPAVKGATDKPQLVTNQTQLLKSYTANEKVEVGHDLSYFSALNYLSKADKLWVHRAINTGYFGGMTAVQSTAVGSSASLAGGTNMADPLAFTFGADDAILFYGANEGAWANDIRIKLTSVVDNADLVEPNSFLVEVFKSSNLNIAIESFLCSRVEGQKDGNGLNMFVEDVLLASDYIRAFSNPLIAGTVNIKSNATVVALADGNDGLAVTDAQMITASDKFLNTAETSVTLLLDGGYATPAYQLNLDTIAQTRGDCVALLSTRYADETSSSYVADILTYRSTTLNLNSSYSALYTPHVEITDTFNDRQLFISPESYAGTAISLSSSNFEIWYPPAGFTRGVVNVQDVAVRFTDGEMDTLVNKQINPIRFIPNKGIVIWGQKTLTSRASALQDLNVRLLLIFIEPAIKNALENFLFELNNVNTRTLAKDILDNYLEGIKSRKGVTDYLVVADSTNNSNADIDAGRMNVDIYLKPSRSISEIPVRVVITPNSISFSDAQG